MGVNRVWFGRFGLVINIVLCVVSVGFVGYYKLLKMGCVSYGVEECGMSGEIWCYWVSIKGK